MNEKEWYRIINTYFTGYYSSLQQKINRRAQRGLYLANSEINNSRFKTGRTVTWNKWYIEQYKINIVKSKNNNIMPTV